MALNVLFNKYHNSLLGEDIIVPRLVNQETMEFQKFCEVIADGSFASAADIGMVMMLIESKLPLLMRLNMRVICTPKGLTFFPRISGSLSESKFRARLAKKRTANPDMDIDMNRVMAPSDMPVSELDATIGIEIPKAWNNSFVEKIEFQRVKSPSKY